MSKRRKPRLDATRVQVIAATFEQGRSTADFEIVGVSLCTSEPGEWRVIVKAVFPGGGPIDGFDACIMVNDRTGQARSEAEYRAEQSAGA